MPHRKRPIPPDDALARNYGSASAALAFDLACQCAETDRPELLRAALPHIPEASLPLGKSEIGQLIAIALHRKSRNFSRYLADELIPSLPEASQSSISGLCAHYVFVANRSEAEDLAIAERYFRIADPQALRRHIVEYAAKGYVDLSLFGLACRFADEDTLAAALQNAREQKLAGFEQAIERPLLLLREQSALRACAAPAEHCAPKPRI